MLQDTIAQIETRLKNAGAMDPAQRAELSVLLDQLKTEVSKLSKTHEEQAQSIASFTDLSAAEATRSSKNPALLRHSILGLTLSVAELEGTHPKLVQVVNRMASILSSMGI